MTAAQDWGALIDRLLKLPPRERTEFFATLNPSARRRVKAELGARTARHYLTRPNEWVTSQLGESTWSGQRAIGTALIDHKRVAVPAAASLGKSHMAARLAVWWIDTHEPGTAFVVTTATTGAQVRAIMWREIGRVVVKLKKKGRRMRANQTELRIPTSDDGRTEELVAFGRKPSDTDPTALQGIHAQHVLVIIDEAGGIPAALFLAIERITVSATSRILAIGNATDPYSEFARICEPGSGWHTIQISAFDSPNFTGEPVDPTVSAGLQTPEWAEQQAVMFGADSAHYLAGVLGQFPPKGSTLSVISPEIVRAALLPREQKHSDLLGVRLGVDVGGGGDPTVVRAVVSTTYGWRLGGRWAGNTPDSQDVINLVAAAIAEVRADGFTVDAVNIDSVGIGWAVVGWLQAEGIHAVGVNAGAASAEPGRFLNVRAELWWKHGRETLANGTLSLEGANDLLLRELGETRWTATAKNQIQIEPKQAIRERIGRSPDDADALLLAMWYDPTPAETVAVPIDLITSVMGRR